MGKSKLSSGEPLINVLKMAVWIGILYIGYYSLRKWIGYMYVSVGQAGSIQKYFQGLSIECCITIALTVTWWLPAVLPPSPIITPPTWLLECRYRSEECSFSRSIIYCSVAFVSAAIIKLTYTGILDKNGNMHGMWFVFILPSLYGFMMYALPPDGIKKVILPSAWLRVVALAIMAAACALFFFARW